MFCNVIITATRYDKIGQKTFIRDVTLAGTTIENNTGTAGNSWANPDVLTTTNEQLRPKQTITYNSRNRVENFKVEGNGTLGFAAVSEIKFDYRPDTSKWRTRYYENGTLQYTKYHFGNHEQFLYPDGTRKDLFYIFLPLYPKARIT